MLYDDLFKLEQNQYPNPIKMKFMPMSLVTGEDENHYNRILTKFAEDKRIIKTRNKHIDFGNHYFMSLEKFKKNFPTASDGSYTADQVAEFTFINGLDYFRRQDVKFIQNKLSSLNVFQPECLPSQYVRSLLVFYKYYIHNQSPHKSDFFDFAIISYFPYFDNFITEKNVSNVLKHIQSSLNIFQT